MDNNSLNALYEYIIKNNYNDFSDKIDQYGIDLNPSEIVNIVSKETLLIYATKLNRAGFVIKLLNTYGKLNNVDSEDKDDKSSLIYTILNNNIDLLKEILPLSSPEKINLALCTAMRTGYLDIINYMIGSGLVDLNYTLPKGNNFLIYAAAYNLPSIVLRLCELSDVDVDEKNNQGASVLRFAADKNFPDNVIQCLLNKKTSRCENGKFRRYHISEFKSVENIIVDKGTYGSVEVAIQKSTNKNKILKRYLGYSPDDFLQDDILLEIFFLRQLNKNYLCESIVELNGYIVENKNFYLVLHSLDLKLQEYFKIVKNLPLSTGYLISIIESTVKAIYKCHSNGICHNDIKSANILVTNNKAYLIDFGISTFSAFSGSKKLDIEYITTPNIIAPEGNNCIFIDENNLIIYNKKSFPSFRKSYKADVYSLGATICDIIFGDSINYYNYISINGIIYQSKLNDTRIINAQSYSRLSNDNINILKAYGEDFYKLIIDMINFNPFKRISIKQMLGIYHNPSNSTISEYKLLNINDLQYRICKSIYHYTSENIRLREFELDYFEEIYDSYKNDVINLNPCQYLNKFYSKIIKSLSESLIEISFDTICSTIIFLNSDLKDLVAEIVNFSTFFSYFYPIFNIYQKLFQEDNYGISFFELTKVNGKGLLNVSKQLTEHLNNIPFTPFTIHVEYIVIKLQMLNVNPDIISRIEWYIMKMIIIYSLSSLIEKSVVISELCQYLLLKYYNDNQMDSNIISSLINISGDLSRFSTDIIFVSKYL